MENVAASSAPKKPLLRTLHGALEGAVLEGGRGSDSYIGPFFDAIEGKEQQDEARDKTQLQSRAPSNSSTSGSSLPQLASEKITKMKVKDLKVLLVESKLKVSVNIKNLVGRLMGRMSSP